MPTFRQSNSKEISEEYIDNQTGLPIFETYDSLKKFSEYLNKNNVLLVFKLHHLQADLDVFHKKFDNILILRDEDLSSDGVQLYQVVKYADIIISDYSSISIDAMVLDIPLIYTLDDYKNMMNLEVCFHIMQLIICLDIIFMMMENLWEQFQKF